MAEHDHVPTFGLLAEYSSAADLFCACEAVRDAGYRHWDAHSPFPIRGLKRAMGLSSSHVPWIAMVCGLGGAALAMLFQWWSSAIDYPLVVSGKPLFAWQAFVPITFEVGVLGAALGAFFGLLFCSRLPRWHHPLFNSRRFEGVTDDRFFVTIEASDPSFDEGATTRFLLDAGAVTVEVIRDV
jgi:hypothetical protein